MPKTIKVVVHEVHARTFEIDVAAMCDDTLWPMDVDHGEIAEIVEHSDSWGRNGQTNLSWMAERLPADGWREVVEVEVEDVAVPGERYPADTPGTPS